MRNSALRWHTQKSFFQFRNMKRMSMRPNPNSAEPAARLYVRTDIGGSMDGPTLRRRAAFPTKKTGTPGLFGGCQCLGQLAEISADLNYLTVQIDRLLDGLYYGDCHQRTSLTSLE